MKFFSQKWKWIRFGIKTMRSTLRWPNLYSGMFVAREISSSCEGCCLEFPGILNAVPPVCLLHSTWLVLIIFQVSQAAALTFFMSVFSTGRFLLINSLVDDCEFSEWFYNFQINVINKLVLSRCDQSFLTRQFRAIHFLTKIFLWHIFLSPGEVIVGCQWAEWSPWSSCSKTCGGGKKQRFR
jgi:hypothetical protein